MQWLYTAERTNDWHNKILCSWLEPTQNGYVALQLFCSTFIASVTMGVFETNKKGMALRRQSFSCYSLDIHPLQQLPCNFGTIVQPLSHSCYSPRHNNHQTILALSYSHGSSSQFSLSAVLMVMLAIVCGQLQYFYPFGVSLTGHQHQQQQQLYHSADTPTQVFSV